MPLHIDYRPSSFDEVIGNQGVVESHKAIFQRESDFPHAVLYQGPSGCGKTTMARIYAKTLGCSDNDLIEINVANNRGIDTARKIQSEMRFQPFGGPVRVYIIDECHQSTKDFQNAMLKALEDSPSHVYFLLCTTDPQQLLPTIKNRCTTFEMSSLSSAELKMLLNHVLKHEEVDDIPQDVIEEIVEISDGCPRQALVTLDKIIDLPLESMSKAIQDMRMSEASIRDLCQVILKKRPWKEVSAILKAIDMANPENIRRAILGYMTTVLLNEDNAQAALAIEFFKEPTYNSGKAGLVYAAYNSVFD